MEDKTARPNEYLKPTDASADIIVSDDEQVAYIGIKPPENGGGDLAYGDLMKLLERRHVVYGVDEDALKALAEKPVYNSMTRIAKGDLPVQGTDAKLAFHFEINREIKPRVRTDGTVDYRDLGLIEQVKEGQALCTLTPADKGMPGKTVLGRALLPQPVRNLALPMGKNTKLSEDRLTLLSAINGCVEYQNGKVNVYNVFTVNGGVGNTTGNVVFDGSIVVNGDVAAGFLVKAAGNINVVGNVEGATLEAGGDIRIVAGLVGQGRGTAACGGSFKALFVENAEVTARGDVTADVFMHSQVRCGGSLIADGRHGSVIGGHYVVARDVRAMTVGAPSGVATTFEMGVDPTVMARAKDINAQVKALEAEQVKLGQIVQLLLPLREANKLAKDKIDILEKAIATKESRGEELARLTDERDELAKAASGAGSASQFICKHELYYGTKVSICQAVYIVPSDLVRCKLYLNPDREIQMVSL
jgi:uncharacterized protein (DUF342 family)